MLPPSAHSTEPPISRRLLEAVVPGHRVPRTNPFHVALCKARHVPFGLLSHPSWQALTPEEDGDGDPQKLTSTHRSLTAAHCACATNTRVPAVCGRNCRACGACVRCGRLRAARCPASACGVRLPGAWVRPLVAISMGIVRRAMGDTDREGARPLLRPFECSRSTRYPVTHTHRSEISPKCCIKTSCSLCWA
jgi:hypothetical protein